MNPFPKWIWQHPDWPRLVVDAQQVAPALAHAHRCYGVVEGKVASIGLGSTHTIVLNAFADEVVATAEIEGQHLPLEVVRSSVMQRLGLADQGPHDRHVEGLVAVLGDATIEVLEARDRWIRALHSWCLDERQGTRRDFALHAGQHTKAIGAGDWKWLEEHFDLERYGVSHFTPMMWVAGQGVLYWDECTVALNAVKFLALPLDDVLRVKSVTAAPAHWWLIENRTSFERQAQQLADGVLLAWMPGRPSTAWLAAIEHLVRCAPAPLRVSADADPAGVDMAWGMGRVWERQGLPWEPFRMGIDELHAAQQPWALNAHDKALISRLLASPDLPQALHQLCLAMQRDGFKAEQEGWL